MPASVHADINLTALRHNLSIARQQAPQSRIMAVVKSLGYGHGAIEVAKALSGQADALAVARMDEALVLRKAGISADILVLEGAVVAEDVEKADQHKLQLVVHQPYQVDLLRQLKLSKRVDCWLKIDSGMHRLGFPVTELSQVYAELKAVESVADVTLMTHLANADDLLDPATALQLEKMHAASAHLQEPLSIANSAGILAWPDSHGAWVRPGIMLYGASPILGVSAAENELQAVMTLRAPLIAVKRLNKGDAVGYGGTWQAPESMTMGVVAIGYGDGYPRHVDAAACALLNGSRAPLIGRVSMDMISLDLRGIDAQVGDEVTLWGEGLPVEEVAGWANTISYTLFCGVTARVPRRYRD